MNLRRLLVPLAGLAVGVALVEGVFSLRDHGAFPHLNVYRADERLGVRLRPGATERISFSKNPVSRVRVNAQGYRGADWPTRADRELFVVGDSQAFGLGVDEADAFAWRLGRALGRPVANGAVPTYGPEEYDAVLAEELPRRRPTTVLYTVNLANDLFEAAHPNATRHAVWDGWAVRKETAPARVGSFPGRALLFRDSHAFFALRGLWFRTGGGDEWGRVPSEGGWRDLLRTGQSVLDERRRLEEATSAERHRRDTALAAKRVEAQKLDAELGKALHEKLDDFEIGPGTLRAVRANPGDIVRVYYGEGSAPVPALAEQIKEAAEDRRRFEERLKELHDRETLDKLARRDALDDEVRVLRAGPAAAQVHARSPLYAHLQRAKALCDENGAELVVVVLPLDVQVAKAEWAKYGAVDAVDLTGTRILADDVLAMAAELGARTVDAWPALAAAEPGAFLLGDLHMSGKGHAAVAEAIRHALEQPRAVLAKLPPLPFGRSAPPAPAEWGAYPFDPSDLRRYGCAASRAREWVRFVCKGARISVVEPGRAQPLVVNTDDAGTLIAPTLEGDRWSARIVGKRTGQLRIDWPLGEPDFEAYLYDAKPPRVVPAPTAEERALCACHKAETGAADCLELTGAAEPGCARAYATDCRPLLACARGDAASPPACAPGETVTDVTHRCVAAPKRAAAR